MSSATRTNAIVIDPQDNVATVTAEVQAGTVVRAQVGDSWIELASVEPIPFGHKIALKPIGEGETIRKYGESIGAARCNIDQGQHVNVHNLRSLRGQTEMLEAAAP